MFDEMLRRKDVQRMFNDICNSECYYNKKMNKSMDYQLFTDLEEILFLFYDALFKYKMIIEEIGFDFYYGIALRRTGDWMTNIIVLYQFTPGMEYAAKCIEFD